MEDVKQIEFWRNKCHDLEDLYLKQKDITKRYKNIIDEYRLIMGIDKQIEKQEIKEKSI